MILFCVLLQLPDESRKDETGACRDFNHYASRRRVIFYARERKKNLFYLHHKSQFSLKNKNKKLSQTLQKMLPMKKCRK